jgi:hypothetical protein
MTWKIEEKRYFRRMGGHFGGGCGPPKCTVFSGINGAPWGSTCPMYMKIFPEPKNKAKGITPVGTRTADLYRVNLLGGLGTVEVE